MQKKKKKCIYNYYIIIGTIITINITDKAIITTIITRKLQRALSRLNNP